MVLTQPGREACPDIRYWADRRETQVGQQKERERGRE